MTGALLDILILVLVVGFLAGCAIFLIRKAPIIPGEFKAGGEWLVYAIAIVIIVMAAWPLLGVSL